MELHGVRAGEALVFKDDHVVEVLHQVARGEVGRSREHESRLGVLCIADDELVVHAAALTVRAGVGGNGSIEGAQSGVGILPFVNPANLHTIGSGVIESANQRLVVEVVRGHVQGVLGGQDPSRHGVVQVGAEGLGHFVGGDRAVDIAVEVHVDVAGGAGHRRVRADR